MAKNIDVVFYDWCRYQIVLNRTVIGWLSEESHEKLKVLYEAELCFVHRARRQVQAWNCVGAGIASAITVAEAIAAVE